MPKMKRAFAALTLCIGIATVLPASPAIAGVSYGPYLFINNLSHLCMDVAHGSTTDGARIQQWYCYGGPPEKWTMVHKRTVGAIYYFQLVNANSPAGTPKCLDVPWNDSRPGVQPQLWGCWDFDGQMWAVETQSLTGTLRIRHYNLNANLCLDVDPNWRNSPGSSLQLQPCNDSQPQQWYLA